jgi:hypothetical protein
MQWARYEIEHAMEVQTGGWLDRAEMDMALQCLDSLDKVPLKHTIYFCSDSAAMPDT